MKTVNLKGILSSLFILSLVLQGYSKVIFSEQYDEQKIVFYFLVALCAMIIFIDRLSLSDIIILLISSVAYIALGNGYALKLFLIVYAARTFELNMLIKKMLAISIIFYIGVVFFGFGNIDVGVFTRVSDSGRVIRETIGFDNPNKAFFFLVPIFISWVYLYGNKHKISSLFLIISVTFIIYTLTYTVTGLIANILLSLLLIFSWLIPSLRTQSRTRIWMVIPITFILFIIISVYIAIAYQADSNINRILSERPKLWYYFIENYLNWSFIFGQAKEETVLPLDNSYIDALVHFGFIFILYLIYMYSKASKLVFKTRIDNSLFLILCLYILVYSLGETLFFEPAYNPSLLIVFNIVRMAKSESINVCPRISS
ncbi:hypothetical protein EYZ00_13050 [Hafnia paralvei]|uniref:Uncharacterized protein n=1 Tax=Hafnia alvei TaxID=569 RepID=A0A172X0G2_HAFAL|nr:hypothetical protein [Hafnia paralvei]ANF30120.1 hypothetical protein [Hafnia alvei]TBL52972.1 hypothetical protein EYZ00_13050 [Hafnia paralvei]